jgi:hypothetical protein
MCAVEHNRRGDAIDGHPPDMNRPTTVPEPELAEQGRRFRKPASWLLLIATALEIPGILLFVLGHSWVAAIGIALVALGAPLVLIGIGLVISAAVTGWAAQRRPFA